MWKQDGISRVFVVLTMVATLEASCSRCSARSDATDPSSIGDEPIDIGTEPNPTDVTIAQEDVCVFPVEQPIGDETAVDWKPKDGKTETFWTDPGKVDLGTGDDVQPKPDIKPFDPGDLQAQWCKPLDPPPPEVGTPCNKVGTVRCSEKGKYPQQLYLNGPAQYNGVCVRPSTLVCEEVAGGGREWVEKPCPAMPPECKTTSGMIQQTCQESPNGGECCPTILAVDNPNPSSAYYSKGAYSCANAGTDSLACNVCYTNTGNMTQCTTLGNAIQEYIPGQPFFSKCGYLAQDCKYYFVVQTCPPVKCTTPYTPADCPHWGWNVCLQPDPDKPPYCLTEEPPPKPWD